LFAFTVGGGATTLFGNDVRDPELPFAELTFGGGGTTSLAPKILPIMLLMIPLPDCEGGGGTTVLPGSGTVPPDMRRMSVEISAEGGGATTFGAGRVSLALPDVARSGAETGGGTTAESILTGALEIWRLTAPGAGGITFEDIAGAERERSRETFGAGATTDASSDGAVRDRSRVTRGAGAMIAGVNAGATKVCSLVTLGAGAISVALYEGPVRARSRVTFGAGAITESSWTPLRV
jgi:hypothetical protein